MSFKDTNTHLVLPRVHDLGILQQRPQERVAVFERRLLARFHGLLDAVPAHVGGREVDVEFGTDGVPVDLYMHMGG